MPNHIFRFFCEDPKAIFAYLRARWRPAVVRDVARGIGGKGIDGQRQVVAWSAIIVLDDRRSATEFGAWLNEQSRKDLDPRGYGSHILRNVVVKDLRYTCRQVTRPRGQKSIDASCLLI